MKIKTISFVAAVAVAAVFAGCEWTSSDGDPTWSGSYNEGGETVAFPYDTLLLPDSYLIKPGDLILDSEGYLYQIDAIGNESCSAKYCGTHIGSGGGGSESRLRARNGKIEQVTENGTVLSSVDHLSVDDNTLYRVSSTGEARVIGIETIDGYTMRVFIGSTEEYDRLTEAQKENLFAMLEDRNEVYMNGNRVRNASATVKLGMTTYRHDIVLGEEENTITRVHCTIFNNDPTNYSAQREFDYDSYEVITPLTADHFAFLPTMMMAATGFIDGGGDGTAEWLVYRIHNSDDGIYVGTVEISDGWCDERLLSYEDIGFITDTVTQIGGNLASGDGVSY
jgi:hypothetical protein